METWRDIKNYEGLYQISNIGRVKSMNREVYQNNNGKMCKHLYKGKILALHRRPPYLSVHLSKNGKAKWLSVHRLVAEAFIPHDEENNIVNHLDCNPLNNKVENLEWTTYSGNMIWASKQGHMKGNLDNQKEAIEKLKRAVIAIDKQGNEFEFSSQAEAALILKCNSKHIASICKNKYGYKTSNGYHFKYKERSI